MHFFSRFPTPFFVALRAVLHHAPLLCTAVYTLYADTTRVTVPLSQYPSRASLSSEIAATTRGEACGLRVASEWCVRGWDERTRTRAVPRRLSAAAGAEVFFSGGSVLTGALFSTEISRNRKCREASVFQSNFEKNGAR